MPHCLLDNIDTILHHNPMWMMSWLVSNRNCYVVGCRRCLEFGSLTLSSKYCFFSLFKLTAHWYICKSIKMYWNKSIVLNRNISCTSKNTCSAPYYNTTTRCNSQECVQWHIFPERVLSWYRNWLCFVHQYYIWYKANLALNINAGWLMDFIPKQSLHVILISLLSQFRKESVGLGLRDNQVPGFYSHQGNI